MRHASLAVSVFAIFSALVLMTACGGGASTGNHLTASTPTNAPSPSPTPAPTPMPTPTPTPAPGATVLDNVEDTANWLTCGSCGNAGGTGPTPNFSFSPGEASPSEDGSSTKFSIAATVAYTNAYFYQEHAPVNTQINALTYEFDLYVPQGMERAPQAFEFECQQILDGWVYNFGWQAYYAGQVWRTFDYGLKRWDSTNIAFTSFTPGTWHHILVEFHNDVAAHTVIHDALTVDGVRSQVNMIHNAFNAGGRDQFTNAVQLDSNSVPAPYSVYVDKMRITYK